jgi:hypothetical protein
MICPLTIDSCKARKLRVIIFQKGVVEMQRLPKRRKRGPEPMQNDASSKS